MTDNTPDSSNAVPIEQVLNEAKKYYNQHNMDEVINCLGVAEKDYRKVGYYLSFVFK